MFDKSSLRPDNRKSPEMDGNEEMSAAVARRYRDTYGGRLGAVRFEVACDEFRGAAASVGELAESCYELGNCAQLEPRSASTREGARGDVGGDAVIAVVVVRDGQRKRCGFEHEKVRCLT